MSMQPRLLYPSKIQQELNQQVFKNNVEAPEWMEIGSDAELISEHLFYIPLIMLYKYIERPSYRKCQKYFEKISSFGNFLLRYSF